MQNKRREQIDQLVEDYGRRFASGEPVTRDALIATHPDLMPELGEELALRCVIGQARARAERLQTASPSEPHASSSSLIDPMTLSSIEIDSLNSVLDTHSHEVSVTPASDSIVGYEILREIHRGGQGVVYQAIQKTTKRKVAIKVMREGPFAGAKDKARFEREVQILAALHHPNIVAIHDSGMAAGNFYFVMDYISGQPLDAWMSCGQRTLELTLRLFAKICEAVNAAHLRGVIHRDLKPGNIRVDAEGEPHVLDFGLAKMATGSVTDESRPQVMTVTGQFMGSLPWASPEQAEGMPGKIDIRTDVYSLGVILYQMLTSKFPYEVVGTMRDVLDRILTAEPVRPSTISRQINDEVETIVLKCLAKERDRRYQSAGELARDIHHYLAGEPIEAKRDSAMYVLRKQIRQYRLPLGITAGFLLMIIASSIVAWTLYVKAYHAREAEALARGEAQTQRDRALKAGEAEQVQRKLTEGREETAQRYLYAARMNLAQQAWRSGDLPRVRRLLDACTPQSNGPDLRHFEWYHLWRLCYPEQAALRGHQAPVLGLAYRPQGNLLVSCSMDQTVRLWDLEKRSQPRVLTVNVEPTSLAVTRDGRWAAVGTKAASVRMWDLSSGQEQNLPTGTFAWVQCVAFSDDGQLLAASGTDKIVHVWDVDSRREVLALLGHEREVRALAFSRDGHCLYSAGFDETIHRWELPSGTPREVLRGHGSPVMCLQFSPDGTLIASGGWDGMVQLWDTRTHEPLRPLKGHSSSVIRLCFSPDGATLATGGRDNTVRIWDVASGLQRSRVPHPAFVGALTFSPDGKVLVTGSWDALIRICELDRVEEESLTFDPAQGPLVRVAFSPDGRFLATGSETGTVKVWDSSTQQLLGAVEHLEGPVALNFSYTGVLASGGTDGQIRIWQDPASGPGSCIRAGAGIVDLVLTRRADRLIALTRDGSLHVFDTGGGREPQINREFSGASCVAISPDDELLAIGSVNSTIALWNIRDSRREAFLLRHEQPVNALAFSPDASSLASVAGRNTNNPGEIIVWDVRSRQVRTSMSGHSSGVLTVCFSSQGQNLITGASDTDKSVKIWDAASGQELATLVGHRDSIRSVAFSGNLSRLASASADQSVRLWRAARPEDVERASGAAKSDTAAGQVGARAGATHAEALRFNNRSWNIVRFPGAALDEYQTALDWARQATQLAPHDFNFLNTLGVAQFRAGAYRDAVDTLTRSDAANGGLPADLAFLAMAHHRLGQTAEALRDWERLCRIMSQPRHAADYENGVFLREATAMLGREVPATMPGGPGSPPATQPDISPEDLIVFEARRRSLEGLRDALVWAHSLSQAPAMTGLQALGFAELLIVGDEPGRAVETIRGAFGSSANRLVQKDLGWALMRCGRQAESRRALELALGSFHEWAPTPPAAADPDHWTAAYLLGLVSQDQYAAKWEDEPRYQKTFGTFVWFYIGQRLESEGQSDQAIAAYRRSVELGSRPNAHYLQYWSAYRLEVLSRDAVPPVNPSGAPATSRASDPATP